MHLTPLELVWCTSLSVALGLPCRQGTAFALPCWLLSPAFFTWQEFPVLFLAALVVPKQPSQQEAWRATAASADSPLHTRWGPWQSWWLQLTLAFLLAFLPCWWSHCHALVPCAWTAKEARAVLSLNLSWYLQLMSREHFFLNLFLKYRCWF